MEPPWCLVPNGSLLHQQRADLAISAFSAPSAKPPKLKKQKKLLIAFYAFSSGGWGGRPTRHVERTGLQKRTGVPARHFSLYAGTPPRFRCLSLEVSRLSLWGHPGARMCGFLSLVPVRALRQIFSLEVSPWRHPGARMCGALSPVPVRALRHFVQGSGVPLFLCPLVFETFRRSLLWSHCLLKDLCLFVCVCVCVGVCVRVCVCVCVHRSVRAVWWWLVLLLKLKRR